MSHSSKEEIIAPSEDIIQQRGLDQDRFAFAESWSRLNRHVEQIPIGWQRLYAELRFGLAVISSPARSTIRIDGAWEEDGCLQVQSDTEDPVVQGVLRKARVRAMHTCMACGKPGKLRQLDDWKEATLCGTCAGPRLLALEIARLIGLERCGSASIQDELRHSPAATLVRAAAEAAALTSNRAADFMLDQQNLNEVRAWLQQLQEHARSELT